MVPLQQQATAPASLATTFSPSVAVIIPQQQPAAAVQAEALVVHPVAIVSQPPQQDVVIQLPIPPTSQPTINETKPSSPVIAPTMEIHSKSEQLETPQSPMDNAVFVCEAETEAK